MSEGNVVRPEFGRKKEHKSLPPTPIEEAKIAEEVAEETSAQSLEGEALAEAKENLTYIIQNQAKVQQVRDKIEILNDFIFSLEGFSVKDKNVRLRRDTLKKTNFVDICYLVMNSNESHWKSQPTYFGALTLEYQYRVNCALSLFPKD